MFTSHSQQYDIILLGNDPVGMTAAIAAARRRIRVAVVSGEVSDVSAALLSETVLELFTEAKSKHADNGLCLKASLSLADIRHAIAQRLAQKRDEYRTQLAKCGIDLYEAEGSFISTNEVAVGELVLKAETIIVSNGTRAHVPAYFECDGISVLDSDALFRFDYLPRSLLLVGGGKSGIVAAACYAQLGVQLTLIDDRGKTSSMQNVSSLTDEVIGIDHQEVNGQRSVVAQLASGGQFQAEIAAINVGRRGNSEQLGLDRADLLTDDRGRLWCNSDLQTWVPHIYGLGEIAGICDEPIETTAAIALILDRVMSTTASEFSSYASV